MQTEPSLAPQRIAVIGGGAAGFFAAITAAEACPTAQVTIYERSNQYLSKVKISGGGRCNVTHSCFDPAKLITHYPRGSRELLGAFHRWQPQDTIRWFAQRGIILKTESDGRMFPETDDSQTIIDCFMNASQEAGIQRHQRIGIQSLRQSSAGIFTLELTNETVARADAVCIATGSLKTSPLTQAIQALGHTIEPLAPSLFAFNVADKRIQGLAGLSVQNASVQVLPHSARQNGPILITHRGFSGPAILRLSAWESRRLQDQNYRFDISINWLGDACYSQLSDQFKSLRTSTGKASIKKKTFEHIPRRLWERIVESANINQDLTWAQLSKKHEHALINELTRATFNIQGKTTNTLKVNDSLVAKGMKKQVPAEFVTAGGICRKEINFRTMESTIISNLYFAGECIDIDGITGGFNFQAAWTTGRIAGAAMIDT